MRPRRNHSCGGSPLRTDDYVLGLEVNPRGAISWDEGELLFPDSDRACSCIARFRQGLTPGTLVDVVGRYERPSRHERFVHVAHVMVAQTPLDAVRVALREWERCLEHELGAERLTAAREQLDAKLAMIADDGSAEAGELRSALLRRVAEEQPTSLSDLLLRRPPAPPKLLSRAYRAQRDAKEDPTPTKEIREALVARIWQGHPYTDGERPGLAPHWDFWVHPLVRDAQESLVERANFPWHFGGPSVEPDLTALWPWLDHRFQDLANEEERAAIESVRGLPTADRVKWLAKLRVQDERRYEREYKSMVSRWRGGPDGLDSPPDDVSVSWDELAASLPATWCRYAFAFAGVRDSHRSVAPFAVGRALADLHAKRRPRLRGAFVLALDAAVILSALDRALPSELERVLFVSAGLTHGRALLELSTGLALLEADQGAFGSWALHRGDEAALATRLPKSESELARMAVHNPGTWPVVSAASHTIVQEANAGTETPRWVRHSRYGRGLVVGSTPGPRGPKLTIEFEGVGRKQLLHAFVADE